MLSLTNWTDRPWWTIDDAAELLRLSTKTVYRSIWRGELPAQKTGGLWKIPAESLGMRVRPETRSRTYHVTDSPEQLELPLDPSCLIPVRRYRNTREVVAAWSYESELWGHNGRTKRSEPL